MYIELEHALTRYFQKARKESGKAVEEESQDHKVPRGSVAVRKGLADYAPQLHCQDLQEWLKSPAAQTTFSVGFIDEPYLTTANTWDQEGLPVETERLLSKYVKRYMDERGCFFHFMPESRLDAVAEIYRVLFFLRVVFFKLMFAERRSVCVPGLCVA